MSISHLKWLVLLAAVAYLPTIAFYYVGEEAIYTISSLEIWHQCDWTRQLLFGGNLQRNPLFNWLIIPFANLFGWVYVLPVARALTISATLVTAGVAGWLALRLLRERALAWFVALVYLSFADIMLYRGWLAYTDPLFGLFVFAAVASLWVACEERRVGLIVVAVFCLTCAFMTKAFTAYVFYGVAILVLMHDVGRRRMLLGLPSIALHAAAVLAPVLWFYVVHENTGQGMRMFAEILAKLELGDGGEYLKKLFLYPLETVIRLSPSVPLLLYFAWRKRISIDPDYAPHVQTALWVILLSYLPYWFSPISGIRYLLPIFPLIAFLIAMLLWRLGDSSMVVAGQWIKWAIALKLVAAVFLFPYYQSHYRGENYAVAARDIIKRTADYPLYTTDDSASGLSVAGYIDTWRLPMAPINRLPEQWGSGFVIAYTLNTDLGKVAQHYRLAGNDLYLLCRGAACEEAR